jgi:hypothetical protein
MKTFKYDESTQNKNVAKTSAVNLNQDFLYSAREMRTLKDINGRTPYLFTRWNV